MDDDLIITLADMAQVRGFSARPGLCRSGARVWAARHGLDWDAFRTQGIAASKLLAVGDAFAVAIVEQTRARRREEAARGQL